MTFESSRFDGSIALHIQSLRQVSYFTAVAVTASPSLTSTLGYGLGVTVAMVCLKPNPSESTSQFGISVARVRVPGSTLARLPKPQAHSLESELIPSVRIVHPEIKPQAADHDGCDSVYTAKSGRKDHESSAEIHVPAVPTKDRIFEC